jgi:hypothetical protein
MNATPHATGSKPKVVSRSALHRNALRGLARAGEPYGREVDAVPLAGDPFLRPLVRSSMRRAVAQAQAATTVHDPEHVARLAFLREAGLAAGVDPDDRARVSELHASYAPAVPSGGGFWPIVAALGIAVTVVAGFFVAKAIAPTPEERFRRSPVGVALVRDLSGYVTSLGKSAAERKEAKAAFLSEPVRAQLGGDLSLKLDAVLVQAAVAQAGLEATGSEAQPLRTAIDDCNDGFVSAKVPAFLDAYAADGDRGARSLWLMAFYAPDRYELAIDGRTLRLARGRRLDPLNLTTTFYVWRRQASRWAAISLGGIEQKLAREILPTIGGDVPLAYEGFPAAETARLSKALAGPLREAYVGGSGVAIDDLRALHHAAAALLESAARHRADTNVVIANESLILPPEEVANLEKHRHRYLHLDDALRAHERLLARRAQLDAVTAVGAEITESVFFGENLLEEVGLEPTEASREAGIASKLFVASARARLALLADEGHAPALAIEALVRESITRSQRVTPFLLGELAKALGRTKPEGEGAREAFVANVEFLMTKPRAEIAAAARGIHERLFGKPAPVLARTRL